MSYNRTQKRIDRHHDTKRNRNVNHFHPTKFRLVNVPNKLKNNIFGHINRLTFFGRSLSSHTVPLRMTQSISSSNFSTIFRNVVLRNVLNSLFLKNDSLAVPWIGRDLSGYFTSTTF